LFRPLWAAVAVVVAALATGLHHLPCLAMLLTPLVPITVLPMTGGSQDPLFRGLVVVVISSLLVFPGRGLTLTWTSTHFFKTSKGLSLPPAAAEAVAAAGVEAQPTPLSRRQKGCFSLTLN